MPHIHPSTKIWNPELTNIYGDCQIGKNCNIGSYVEIGPGVKVGNHVSIAAFCFIPYGVTIEDHCFIGPRVTFCNDKYPPGGRENWQPILVKEHASIGAGSIILPGVTIGKKALIGAGSIVCQDIPDGWRVVGNPCKRIIPPVINCMGGEIR
jgi:acetyltransferase-like isoleucine patch superfamily enzyme